MIIIYHQDYKVLSIWNKTEEKPVEFPQQSLQQLLFFIAKKFPSSLIVWCHNSQKDNLNLEQIPSIFHHKKIMASYNPSENNYLPDSIGYVEETPFIKINKEVHYPTWQMSSCVGGIHAEILNSIAEKSTNDFDYFLNSIAKKMMPLGLLCYSAPELLLNKKTSFTSLKATNLQLFKFVKQHYRTRWVFLLFLDLILYEKKVPIFSLIGSLFYKRGNFNSKLLDTVVISSSKKGNHEETIDVIIPTIGRKKYLYDVLSDLRNQTHLPQKVIIVEQNPLPETTSELDYLQTEVWPFEIEHIFTHQTGACNARNIALSKIRNNWVFLADDDIRIPPDFFEQAFEGINTFAADAVTFNCYREGDRQAFEKIFQWITFGSGCSMVRREVLEGSKFSMKYEFGFGEDADYGMQLRNSGTDVLYFPQPSLLHLKAPVGGFRTKLELPWENDVLQPKPSPTVMLYKLEHFSSKQLWGYKTILFFKFYRLQPIKNPIQYYKNFQKRWQASLFWAQKIHGYF